MKTKWSMLLAATAALLISTATTFSGAISPVERNEKLLGYNEAYESLTEVSLGSDLKKISAAWKEAKSQRDDIVALLDEAGAKKFDELLAIAAQANKQKKNVELSLAAVELYKFVVLACDASALEVPATVHIMDYVGFRSKALLQMQPIDWKAVADNSTNAQSEWQKVSGQVSDKNLFKSVNEAIDGMVKGASAHDANLVRSATESELALVDELETNLNQKNNTQQPVGIKTASPKIYTKQETQVFTTLANETLAALLAKNKDIMIMKLTDLESAWDDNEGKLRPRNEEKWQAIDKTLDQGINSLRSTHYDEVKGRQALEALLKVLADATE